MEPILRDFEDFARSHTTAGAEMDVRALRDHAEEMLRAFAQDMGEEQSSHDQQKKSWGDMPEAAADNPSAATRHGTDRAGHGFTLEEMFAEYRALRASVMRHWTAQHGGSTDPEIQDMIRFNEALDQAVAESITRYASTVNDYREMFLAVLGHDLRTPLSAIQTASEYLVDSAALSGRPLQMATTIHRSGARMNDLVDDLLDFTLTRLGMGIPIERKPADMVAIVRPTVDEVRLMHPEREFRFETAGDVTGEWDPQRVAQAVSNLVANAVQHGATSSPITLVVHGGEDDVIVAVRNRGNVIPTTQLAQIFEPFRRGQTTESSRHGGSLGLGLHIAQQIAQAHEGTIEVDSSAERGTTFSLRLPRHASAPARA